MILAWCLKYKKTHLILYFYEMGVIKKKTYEFNHLGNPVWENIPRICPTDHLPIARSIGRENEVVYEAASFITRPLLLIDVLIFNEVCASV